MFGRSKAVQNGHSEGESRQPLLAESSHEENIVFSAYDSDNENDIDGEEVPSNKLGHNVRFQENVQVIGPPLRSTMASREAAYELDDDEIDDTTPITITAGHMDQRMPLLVGMLQSPSYPDGAIPLHETGGLGSHDIDLDVISAKILAGGGIFDSISNMANSILGAGIIGLPYALNQAGFFMGLFLLIVLCCITDWTIRLIVINAKLSGRSSYIDIMDHCFGPSGRAAVSFFQFTFAFGGMCAFGIIIGDTIPHVVGSVFPSLYHTPILYLLTNRQFVIALCTIGVSYPLSLYRDIHHLARASGLALVSMIIIVVSVLIEGPKAPPELRGDPSKRFSVFGPGVFQAIGVISFAFVCHHNSLLIYGSLRTPTLDRFTKVTHISTFISFIACCTLALPAYIVFTDKTQGNILNNFASNNTLINVARFCFGLNMFTTLPLELFVCREVVEQYFFSHESFSLQRHVFFTTTILTASMLVALITCDLGVMLEITGGASATTLAFIFPAACYLKLSGIPAPWYTRAKLPAYSCAAFGIVVMVISLYLALGKTWTSEGDPRICI